MGGQKNKMGENRPRSFPYVFSKILKEQQEVDIWDERLLTKAVMEPHFHERIL